MDDDAVGEIKNDKRQKTAEHDDEPEVFGEKY